MKERRREGKKRKTKKMEKNLKKKCIAVRILVITFSTTNSMPISFATLVEMRIVCLFLRVVVYWSMSSCCAMCVVFHLPPFQLVWYDPFCNRLGQDRISIPTHLSFFARSFFLRFFFSSSLFCSYFFLFILPTFFTFLCQQHPSIYSIIFIFFPPRVSL